GRAGFVTRAAMSYFAPRLREWDVRTSSRVHHFIANSNNVADRIRRYYKREADIIHAPVDTSLFKLSEKDEGYYLIVSALVPYKRVDLAIEVFNKLGDKLVIVGKGPETEKLKAIALKNIEFLGWQSDEELAKLYAGCRALIFPGVEDFGIVPLEAMACGKPVVAFAQGGALETVVGEGDHRTGIFFYEQTVSALTDAIQKFCKLHFNPTVIRSHAEQFSRTKFKEKMQDYIVEKMQVFPSKEY
ncbi:MAG: glycosyltransferase, partial [Ignavibacteriales bacterium]|nr:glycosyltransferase [Ignavibacteriales bacterium]